MEVFVGSRVDALGLQQPLPFVYRDCVFCFQGNFTRTTSVWVWQLRGQALEGWNKCQDHCSWIRV